MNSGITWLGLPDDPDTDNRLPWEHWAAQFDEALRPFDVLMEANNDTFSNPSADRSGRKVDDAE